MAAVLVHIDLGPGGAPDPSSLLALAAGRHIASSWGATLYAALIVHDPDHQPTDTTTVSNKTVHELDATELVLGRIGADKIVIALTNSPVAPLWATIGETWQGVLDHLRPRLVLFGADSASAGELAPRTGARIGARLLVRARALGIDDVELRDRDGGYVRSSDTGAAVAMIGRAEPTEPADADIDLLVLALPGGVDPRIELVSATTAEVAHTCGVVVALGDDVVGDPNVVANARKLAALLNARLVGSAVAARAGLLDSGAVVERTTPMAPELCVTIGNAQLDLAGATSVIRIGAPAGKTGDGALPGLVEVGIAELVKRLEGM